MESSLKSSIEAVSNRVLRLEADRAAPAKKRATTESRSHWADRDDMVDGSATPRWSPSDEEEDMEEGSEKCARGTSKSIKLSDANATLISSAFSTVLPNEQRRRLREAFPTTELAETRCPRLDPLFRTSSVRQEARTADAELARIQALVHDPMAPLMWLQHALDEEGEKACPWKRPGQYCRMQFDCWAMPPPTSRV